MKFIQIFRKLLFLLNSKDRKRTGLLLILTIITAFLEMIGVASILPFMAILTNTSLIETNLILNRLFQFFGSFGIKSQDQFLFFFGVIVFLLLIFSLIIKALTQYAQTRFMQIQEYKISKRLFEGYLYQPYSWFLDHNSADIGKTILSEVSQVLAFGFKPFIEIVTKGLISIAIIALLIIVNYKLTIIVSISFALIYGSIFYVFRKFLKNIGEQRLKSNNKRFTIISEAFGASKEVKVSGLEENYIKNFSTFANSYARTQALSILISQLPRFALEGIAFGGILLIILYMISQSGDFINAIPILSLYVFAAYRLMPSVQQIYTSLTELTFVGPSLEKLHNDFQSLKNKNKSQNKNIFEIFDSIELDNVSYHYPNSSRIALKNINLSILSKSKVGFIGTTGSGKTTLVDIILGLLESNKGNLKVDGKIVDIKNVRSWQKNIGYVPQHIYLSDDTISANIAFGLDTKDINQDIVKKVAKMANLYDFIANELPNQYQTIVGERGVRLSGGQRQRIGIARALYHKPNVLILDEATSALDNKTEKTVMNAINNLSKDITVIIIAHRINTLEDCDVIYKMEKGEIIKKGSFSEIFIDG